ncbi:MAG TPA: hypothetical protein VK604_08645 [Bryobacteraceae bacterium]|nr:hypothetical protein [Bryobacteraceae bacterium]
MTARSIRRAAERKANKLARKAQGIPFHPGALPSEAAPLKHESSEKTTNPRVLANRANAQFSTGPTSFEGKAKVSLNAVKTGLTGRTVLLPNEDAAEYQQYLGEYESELQPVGVRERDLVQSIADTMWRLRRIPGLEMALFAHGRLEFAGLFDAHDPSLHAAMIEFHTTRAYERDLRNLRLQEARLQRRREKETAELAALQAGRKAREWAEKQQALDAVAQLYIAAKHHNQPFEPVPNGFEFSIADIESYLERVSSSWFDKAERSINPNIAKTLDQVA